MACRSHGSVTGGVSLLVCLPWAQMVLGARRMGCWSADIKLRCWLRVADMVVRLARSLEQATQGWADEKGTEARRVRKAQGGAGCVYAG